MAFIDEVKLHIKAGDGGDGVVRWRREKFISKGGPGGGDGGNGGNVFARVVSDLAYLEFYKNKKKFSAENGFSGGNFGKHGRNGKDLILNFPRGTILKNLISGEEFDLRNVEDKILILKGGHGGLGNEHFKSSTNTTPFEWTPGKNGEEADFYAELKLFADVGIIGLPSSGKSTLLNALTNSRSKTGSYHFTTLEPHLGDLNGYILADIPGLILGASKGKGLGFKFLKHISRTNTLIHVISLESQDPFFDYKTIRNELKEYGHNLDKKNEIILLSKNDLVDGEKLLSIIDNFKKVVNHNRVFSMTAFDEESIQNFKSYLLNIITNKNNFS